MNYLTTLYIHGKDAKDFLQGKITCDMNLLIPLKAQPGACCNLQGRIIALFFVMIWKEGYLLLLPKNILKNTLKHFKKYAVFSKIMFEQNPDLRFIGFLESSDIKNSIENLQEKSSETSQAIYRCFDNLFIAEYTKNNGSIESTPSNDKTPDIQRNNALDNNILGDNAWHYQQLLHGFPDISPETTEVFLPHRMGLQNIDSILNFKKGCYLGQEIIARTHFKATLKHTVCFCDKPIGEVFDSAFSPENVQHFLCAIKNEELDDADIKKHIIKKF
jgi:folate-binding protein YgfZ